MRSCTAGAWGRLTTIACLGMVGAAYLCALPAIAGGGPENVLVIIDPEDPDSSYLGNYYISARGIPHRNVIYLGQNAQDYSALVNHQIEAVLGELSNRGIEDHIDYIVLASGSVYRVSASGYITDEDCLGVSYFSLSSTYTLARLANAILGGDSEEKYGLTSIDSNGYSSGTDSAVAFESDIGWVEGEADSSLDAPRYFIGAMLGYTGPRGNTPGEIVAMIDRGIASDGTRPLGTFYYMKTTDDARSGPRDPFFADAIDSITSLGGQAQQIEAVLPEGHHDCLGVMTGWASPAVETADMTLLPGAFCDHLTSWAATFDKSSQTKVSAWIAKGASGSHGTIEEPCAIAGKFPHPRMHVYYYQGLSLGESVLRSLGYLPYQTLIYGDPLTQPFTHIPIVEVPDAPTGVVSGVLHLTPEASTTKPDTGIGRFDLFVDGLVYDSIGTGGVFSLDTTTLADGMHDFRVVAFDDSPVATQGRWMQRIETNNFGRSATLNVVPPVGDLSTVFNIEVSASGGTVTEIRVVQNGRVVTATQYAASTLPISGATLGGGPVCLTAEAEFDDGRMAYSDVSTVGIDFGGACCAPDGICRQLSADACGQLCGGVYAGDGTSCISNPCSHCWTGDFDTNGSVDLRDFAFFQDCISSSGVPPEDDPPGRQADCQCAFDFDDDVDVDLDDYSEFCTRLTGPCPEMPNTAPVALYYTKDVSGYDPTIVEFPTADSNGDPLSYTILTPPDQAVLEGSGPTRVLRPDALASGTDTIEFRVEDPRGAFDEAMVTLRYPDSPPTFLSVSVSALGEPNVPITYDPADKDGKIERTTTFVTWFANDGSTLTLTAPAMHGATPFVRWVVNGQVKPDGVNEISVPLDQNIVAVATYFPPCRVLQVRANKPGIYVINSEVDINGEGGGYAPYDRTYTIDVPTVHLQVFWSSEFSHWKLDGEDQEPGQLDIWVPQMNVNRIAVALYSNISGDFNGDLDVDLEDFAAFQRCFSLGSPSTECLEAFDLEPAEGDGDIDLEDYAEVCNAFTGPF